MPLLFLCELVGILTEPYVFSRFLGAHPCKERPDAGWDIALLIPKEREKCATVSSFGLVFPRSKGNAAIRRPELFGQFNLCQAKLMPCPVQGNSKKIANIVHTFTLPIVFILIGTTLLMNAV